MIWYVIIGIIVGFLFGYILFRNRPIGKIRVDNSDPDSGPYLFLELSHKGMDTIYKKKFVTLEVLLKDHIPPK